MAVADFNGDGIPDLGEWSGAAFDGRDTGPGRRHVLPRAAGFLIIPAISGALDLADVNGDGAPDLLATTTGPQSAVTVMVNAADDVSALAGAAGSS